MTDDDITAISSAAFLKHFGKHINQIALLCALAATLILGLKQHNSFLAASLVFYLLQSYFAVRCAFDAAIFNALSGNSVHYQQFDNVLVQLKLKKTPITPRPLNERVKAAMRLLHWQVISFIIQILLLMFGLMIV